MGRGDGGGSAEIRTTEIRTTGILNTCTTGTPRLTTKFARRFAGITTAHYEIRKVNYTLYYSRQKENGGKNDRSQAKLGGNDGGNNGGNNSLGAKDGTLTLLHIHTICLPTRSTAHRPPPSHQTVPRAPVQNSPIFSSHDHICVPPRPNRRCT